ncbi:type III pantothenate kinase [Bifidobacterium vespertilionis]|uniref:Type III pantothenate kinase n=1 Tax=Bifidobacterium vespertilionis TaxID=2562524 RepID=A0A5J5DZ23_9BIFI|nr:type III pantothenate kinase [Bifidobacterium vespertilionis]KAA8821970.1 type III pantothenate kinase [Bifidobacterium vespertilionis]KAA8823239.1 type III pantothenate kinase [Bifidobacterium vespertilionis]
MLLAVDIGNTNISVGFLDGGEVVGTYRITTKSHHTADEYALMLKRFMAMSSIRPREFRGVIISSVVPKVMHAFRGSIIKFLGLDPVVVGPGVKTGLDIRLDNPKAVGADRIADSVGAYELYGGPVLVIDFGTATTYDYVDAKGAFRSGAIGIGLQTAANALWGGTAQLPEVELGDPGTVMGTNTVAAMRAGLFYGFLGGVEYTIRQFRRETGVDFQVVATGGMGRVIANATSSIDVYDRDLIFKGLAIIHSRLQ